MADRLERIITCDICNKKVQYSTHPWFFGWLGARIGFWKRDGFFKKKYEYDICEECFKRMVEFCKKGE